MKKVVSLALCLVVSSFVLAGCSSSNDSFTQKEYTANVSQIREINIDVRDKQIEVSISEDNQIHIVYFENNKESYDIAVSDKNILTMTSTDNKKWTDYIGIKSSDKNRKISLKIPDALLDTLTLSTTNEDISLPALSVTGNINISSNGGSIAFVNLNVGNSLILSVKNGDIFGAVAGSYDDFSIYTEIKKGKSNLPNSKNSGEKMLTVSSNNGDVNIEFINK